MGAGGILFGLDDVAAFGHHPPVARKKEKEKELWPAWATWALIGVAATSLLTIAATLNDIF